MDGKDGVWIGRRRIVQWGVANEVCQLSEHVITSHLFFFQAEDGIRDGHVTGVQTCALPIWMSTITLCTAPFTSVHQPTAAALRSASEAPGSPGITRSTLAYPTRFSTTPFDSGSWASQKSGRKPKWLAKRTYPGCGTTTLATTPALRQAIRSART